MRGFRTFISAVAILVGAALVVAWFSAWLLLTAVDDGVVGSAAARGALSTPDVTARIDDAIMTSTSSSLTTAGVDLEVVDPEGSVRTALVEWTLSDDFRQLVLNQVDAAREQVREALGSPDRPRGPLSVTIDVSDPVNTLVSEVPGVGQELPEFTIAPVDVEVVSADGMEAARTGYSRLEWAQDRLLWFAGALLLLSLVVSTRRSYVIPKFIIAVGALALGLVVVVTFVSPNLIAGILPGGDEGTWGRLVVESFHDAALPGIRRAITVIGTASVLAGALMAAILRSIHVARH